jgi:multidrug transporter EmrE-like cation transporter
MSNMAQYSYLIFAFIGILLNSLAQVFLKKGVNIIGYFEFTPQSLGPVALKALTNLYIWGGLSCYGISVILWIMALSRSDISLLYPLLSVGYIVTAIAGYYFFGESLSGLRILGIGTIIVGVYFVLRS